MSVKKRIARSMKRKAETPVRMVTASTIDRDMSMFSLVLAISCKVLCDEFGFGRLPKDKDPDDRYRLVRFARAVAKEIDQMDTRGKWAADLYCEKIYQEYGVRFAYK